MPFQSANVDPALLTWGRNVAGYSRAEAASLLGHRSPTRIKSWETGTTRPTIAELRRVAQSYGVPLAMFYLVEVPDELRTRRLLRRPARTDGFCRSTDLQRTIELAQGPPRTRIGV